MYVTWHTTIFITMNLPWPVKSIIFKDNQKGIDARNHKTAIHSYAFEDTEFIIMF